MCHNRHISFFAKPGLSQVRALLVVRFPYLYDMQNKPSSEYHFRSYSQNQTIFFPQRINKDIAEDYPVRLVSRILEQLDLSSFHLDGLDNCPFYRFPYLCRAE